MAASGSESSWGSVGSERAAGVAGVAGTGLADVAGADVEGVGDGVGLFAVGLVGGDEAVEVDLEAVPVLGDGDVHVAGAALLGLGEEAGLGVGAVDEDVDLVVGVGGGDLEVGLPVDLDLSGSVESGGVEAYLGEGALAEGEGGVVDVEGVGTGGGDEGHVALDELADLGGGVLLEEVVEGDVDGVVEGGAELSGGGEAEALGLLRGGAGVLDVTLIGVHGPFAGAPAAANDGTDTVFEGGKDAFSWNTHSCLVF